MDGSQKEGGNFLNLLQKEGGTQKEGVPLEKRGGSNLEEIMFRTAAVFSFFRTVTFSQELFFQKSVVFGVKILQSSHFLRTGSSLRQVLFGTAIFFGGTV